MFQQDLLICRLCRKSSNSLVDIYNQNGTRGLIVWKVIKDLIQLDLSKDDTLPHTICENCLDKVVEFRNFKAMCILSRIEFLKSNAGVGLVENELSTFIEKHSQTSAIQLEGSPVITAGASAARASGVNETLCNNIEVKLQKSVAPEVHANKVSPSIRRGTEELSNHYMQPRLDEGIGSLKACEAPNCCKVFSTYKALVIHKRARHSNPEAKAVVAAGSPPSARRPRGSSTDRTSQCRGATVQGRIHIAEFVCQDPSCGKKFRNLSSLLGHQGTHHPVESKKPGKTTPELEVIDLASDDGVEVVDSETKSGERETCRDNPCSEGDLSDATDQDSPPDPCHGSQEGTVGEEAEFLCHHLGCGRSFHTFDKLLDHKKRNHRERTVPCRSGTRGRNSSSELRNLQIDLVGYGERSATSRTAGEEGKQRGSEAEKSRGSSGSPGTRRASTRPSQEFPLSLQTYYPCIRTGCHLVFGTLEGLMEHRAQSGHERSREDSGGIRNGDRDEGLAVSSSGSGDLGIVEEESVGVRGTGGPGETQGGAVACDQETEFQCEFPTCRGSFANFNLYSSHYLTEHAGEGAGRKRGRPQRSKRKRLCRGR